MNGAGERTTFKVHKHLLGHPLASSIPHPNPVALMWAPQGPHLPAKQWAAQAAEPTELQSSSSFTQRKTSGKMPAMKQEAQAA
jgi:hypothetical protein